ncbi:MAG: BrnA antitoxin family protein [Nitrospirae bacterium]|nr:BrnA antitoxin family protein [Nitrospirota bacterium]
MKKSLIDKNGEVRELTKEDFKRMRPASEVVPEIVKAYKEGRLKVRGPQKAPTKVQTTLRLQRDVIEFFRSTGRGWQTKIETALKEYMKAHSR